MRTSKARIAVAAAVLSTAGVAGVAVPVSNAQKDSGSEIDMVMKGKVPVFEAPRSVKRGTRLTIVNSTSPMEIGPHTFSLVDPADLPARKDWRKCGEKLQLLCGEIAADHKINPKTFKIGKPVVDRGRKGFDAVGDSWFTQTEDATFARKVTAKAGTKLTYFCAVHPNMQGKIKVTE